VDEFLGQAKMAIEDIRRLSKSRQIVPLTGLPKGSSSATGSLTVEVSLTVGGTNYCVGLPEVLHLFSYEMFHLSSSVLCLFFIAPPPTSDHQAYTLSSSSAYCVDEEETKKNTRVLF